MAAAGDRTLRFGFCGAGAVNFGGAEGPWDHASRLERMSGVSVVGIADVDTARAQEVLAVRRSDPQHGDVYANCKVYSSMEAMLDAESLDAVIIGIPPVYRGSLERDVELTCVKKGVHVFVEKPLSVTPPEKFDAYVDAMIQQARQHGVIVSVGYMFRYHDAVVKMKELISAHGGKVMGLNARYYTAYSEMDHAFWWDVPKSGGPIVEQATHFADLARHLGGDVDMTSVQTIHIPASDEPGNAGHLSKIHPTCDKGLKLENRAPRATVSQWRFKDGGLGQMMHMVALHGKRYEANLEVIMDGLRMHLYEPYTTECQLRVRGLMDDKEEESVFQFGDADPYKAEMSVFVDAIRRGNTSDIQSTYSDAANTYNMTWAIRRAAEQNAKKN